MKIDNQSYNYNFNRKNNVNFTSIVPLKVSVSYGRVCSEPNIKKAARKLSDLLTCEIYDNQEINRLRKFFSGIDRDFRYTGGERDKGQIMRPGFSNGIAYFFTGPHAEWLDEIGNKIGPLRTKAKKSSSRSRQSELKKQANLYFAKIREFISSEYNGSRISENINPKTRGYSGDELTLHIYAQDKGIPGQPNFKFYISKIAFEKEVDGKPVIVNELTIDPDLLPQKYRPIKKAAKPKHTVVTENLKGKEEISKAAETAAETKTALQKSDENTAEIKKCAESVVESSPLVIENQNPQLDFNFDIPTLPQEAQIVEEIVPIVKPFNNKSQLVLPF